MFIIKHGEYYNFEIVEYMESEDMTYNEGTCRTWFVGAHGYILLFHYVGANSAWTAAISSAACNQRLSWLKLGNQAITENENEESRDHLNWLYRRKTTD